MILLKANAELKTVFQRLIKTMGVNVNWSEVFVVLNNNLILAGTPRSMFLNFDNKKVTTNIVDLPLDESKIELIVNDTELTNAINIALYAFGKWGVIKGVKVDKDYAQLNHLFQNILQETGVEPSFRDDNFRFFKNSLQITYEDVIQEILDSAKKQEAEEAEDRNTGDEKTAQEEGDYELGLWHNMRWLTECQTFHRERCEDTDSETSRMGHNFYRTAYKCPACQRWLHMVLFPVNREFRIETDEERVYLARAYTCNTCNSFYTPRPGRLIQEGDIYALRFEEDKTAYEDYLELLGRTGTKSPNYKFNEYESQRNKKPKEPQTLKKICQDLETLTEQELSGLQEKIDSGFYPWNEAEQYADSVEQAKLAKGRQKKEKKLFRKEKSGEEQESGSSVSEVRGSAALKAETTGASGEVQAKADGESSKETERKEAGKKEAADSAKAGVKKQKEKYDAHMAVIERMSPRQLTDLKSKIQAEQEFQEEEKRAYVEKIDKVLYRREKALLKQKAEACREKSYAEIARTVEEIKNETAPDDVKESILQPLYQLKKIRAEKEVEHLISHMPENMDKRQYQQFCEKLEQYREADLEPYRRQLDARRDMAEKQEINNYIRRANKKDRNALFRLYNELQEQGFAERNTAPFLEKIFDKIYEMDEAAIAKICPDMMDLSFEEGLRAYEKIESGMFLPKLKISMLDMLEKRLTKIKMDECSQLVRKLQRDMEEKVKDVSRIYYYNPRQIMRGETEGKDSEVINRALNTYAAARNKYEYPIVICDSSRSMNGKEGFVLTPDYIYYNSLFHNGRTEVLDIESVTANTGLLNKGIFINPDGEKKVKITNAVQPNDMKAFAKVMDDFVSYLQEKPESRNISYLAKEKHEVKCCYRCGYTYKGGTVCPKCGSKENK